MSCEHCTDEDGLPCFPTYGLAPHSHVVNNGVIVGTILDDPKPVSGFTPSVTEPSMGVWWCEYCEDGKP